MKFCLFIIWIAASANAQPQCQRVARSSSELNSGKSPVKEVVTKMIDTIKARDARSLLPYFHPRLKMKQERLEQIFRSYQDIYGTSIDISLYRLWHIKTKDTKVVECKEDELSLGPHYGYEEQFAVWLQIQGDRDIGRSFFTLVNENGWKMGVWHTQQWTFQQKDPEQWTKEGLSIHKTFPWAGFVYLDIAAKLMDGAGYIFLQAQRDVEATREHLFSMSREFTNIKSRIDPRIVKIGSLFASDGPGIDVSFLPAQNSTVADLKPKCINAIRQLYHLPEFSWPGIGSARCTFVDNRSDELRESALGGFVVTMKEIREKDLAK